MLAASAVSWQPVTTQAVTYTNPTHVTIPGTGTSGPGDPYPSSIPVTGLPDTARSVRVTLRGLSHSFPDDIDALLQGPGGQAVPLMFDRCGPSPLSSQSLVFDDTAPGVLADAGPCPDGTYQPSFQAGSFPPLPSPAPQGPYVSAIQQVTSPVNGTWSLWIADDTGNDTGDLAFGWALDVFPNTACFAEPATVETLIGTPGNDYLIGTPGRDVIVGLGGRDKVFGKGGDDLICGGPGRDVLNGGAGRDSLRGEQGKDKLIGGGGADRLQGSQGRDVCIGGDGHDTARSCEARRDI